MAADGRVGFCVFQLGQSCCPAFCFRFLGKGGHRRGRAYCGWGQAPFLCVRHTPYSAQNRFRDLLQRKSPLVLVFMANFGHPITRTFASRYANTYGSLRDGGFALVVRSRADKLSRSIGPNTLPYPLLCDAEKRGCCMITWTSPKASSTLMTYSLEGWRILREAKRQGYQAAKGQMQQLPLTLILEKDGTVPFCHYGASLTDVPTDCEAMQSLLEELELVPDMPELEDLDYEESPGKSLGGCRRTRRGV